MTNPSLRYSSYLVRIWHASEGDAPSWRVYLQDLTTGERTGFVNLAALLAFLETNSAEASTLQRKGDTKTSAGLIQARDS